MLRNPLLVFVFLQALDIATTLMVLAMGGQEMNPIVAHAMSVGPIGGLLISKAIVLALAAAGAAFQKQRGIQFANFAFAGIVVWNVTVIARLAML